MSNVPAHRQTPDILSSGRAGRRPPNDDTAHVAMPVHVRHTVRSWREHERHTAMRLAISDGVTTFFPK